MSDKTNIVLNIGTLAAMLVALIVGSLIAADLYDLVNKATDIAQKNSIKLSTTAQAVNTTVIQLKEGQEKANARGNATIKSFEQLFDKVLQVGEENIGNLTRHRIIANMSYAELFYRLDYIAHQLNHSYTPPLSNLTISHE